MSRLCQLLLACWMQEEGLRETNGLQAEPWLGLSSIHVLLVWTIAYHVYSCKFISFAETIKTPKTTETPPEPQSSNQIKPGTYFISYIYLIILLLKPLKPVVEQNKWIPNSSHICIASDMHCFSLGPVTQNLVHS